MTGRMSLRVIGDVSGLSVDDVVHRRVLCPACHEKEFAMWPEGWDSHAAQAGVIHASRL